MLRLFAFSLVLCVGSCAPFKRAFLDPSAAYQAALNATWLTFWSPQQQMWNQNDPACNSGFSAPSVWNAAVAAKAVTDSYDGLSAYSVAQLLIANYQNPQGWFLALTNKDNDCYTDDNAQVAWVLVDSYQVTRNQAHLAAAQQVVGLIRSQWYANGGGVRWLVNGDYLASISTAEAALAAMRVYDVAPDPSLVLFADLCVEWLFANLQDPKDGLLFDGKQASSGTVNDGKLTYSVGTAMSALAYLYKHTGNTNYVTQAINLGSAATNRTGAFYLSSGIWNNPLQYLHLLFAGFADLLTLAPPQSGDQERLYQFFAQEVTRQAQYVFQYLQIDGTGSYTSNLYSYLQLVFQKFAATNTPTQGYKPDPGNFCGGNVNGRNLRSLMDNALALQVFHEASRVLW